MDAAVCGGLKLPFPRDCRDPSMNGGNRWARFAQSEAFNDKDELFGQLRSTEISAGHARQTDQSGRSVAGQPALRGAKRNAGGARRLRQCGSVLEVGSQRRKSNHRPVTLNLGQFH